MDLIYYIVTVQFQKKKKKRDGIDKIPTAFKKDKNQKMLRLYIRIYYIYSLIWIYSPMILNLTQYIITNP